ncbi:uncharacterized protein [Taeniopygia guttata]|uniref:uncharacterized protein n=1 Tax=Taeniopygia guttata TaxID=59729 RepID=UPI003BB86CA6
MRDFVHKSISTIAFTRISAKEGDKTEQKREYLEVVILQRNSRQKLTQLRDERTALHLKRPRTPRPPRAPRAILGTRRSPSATEETREAPTTLASGPAAVRGPAGRGAPVPPSAGRERGRRLSHPGTPAPPALRCPQRCPARSPASRPPPPPLPLCSLSPPARSQPPRRCRRTNMADGRVRATSRGRERGRAEPRRSPAPGAAPRPARPGQRGRLQPSHGSDCRFAALAAPARVCVFATLFGCLLKAGRLHLDPKSIQEKRHPDHRGGFAVSPCRQRSAPPRSRGCLRPRRCSVRHGTPRERNSRAYSHLPPFRNCFSQACHEGPEQ